MLEFIEIAPGCPYYGWPTTVDLTCEEGLCFWIRQPINVISSLAHLFVAIYLLKYGNRVKSVADQSIGTIASFIALASMSAHATHTKLLGSLDFTMQYFLLACLIWMNFRRNSWALPVGRKPFCLVVWGIFATLQWHFMELSLTFYWLLVGVVAASEFNHFLKNRGSLKFSYWPFWKCAGLLIVGAITFYLDSERIICDPHNHWFQLHAIWHVLSAGSLYYLAVYYRQFNEKF